MSVRYHLAPLLDAGARAWTRLTGRGRMRFQIIILHHVPREQYDALRAFLRTVQNEHGFLTPAEAAQHQHNPAAAAPHRRSYPCLLTFDDGFASALDMARDVLAPLGIKAVFFVCPGLIDLAPQEREHFVRQNVFRGTPPADGTPALMTWNEIDELIRLGHVVGAHGAMHLRLSTLDSDQLESEIVGAGRRLTERLGRFPEWYAYAFGDVGAVSAAALQTIQRHYAFCRTGIRGDNGRRNPPGILYAQEINLRAPSALQRAILNSAFDLRYCFARQTIRRRAARP